MNLLYQKMGTDGEIDYKEIPLDTVDRQRIESMQHEQLLYQQKMGSDGKTYYEEIPIERLTDKLRGGAGELGFKYFYEKNKEYVKKWKEVLVKRQLFEMWHALTPKEQKVWIDKATRFDKLFAMTNNLVLKYSDKGSERQIFQELKDSNLYPSIKYKTSLGKVGEKNRQELHDAVDTLEHAYDMFCENSKITNPQMRVTNVDVKDHLSRMWEAMDRESQNKWNYSAGDTLPIRHRGVRGLNGDFKEE
jgi:hypothetical protein